MKRKSITKKQLDKLVKQGKLKEHHSSLCNRYYPRTVDPDTALCYPYEGKFGKGYTYEHAYPDSTRYHLITYFVEVD